MTVALLVTVLTEFREERSQAIQTVHKNIETPIRPPWLQPVLVNRVKNLRLFGS